MATTTSRWTEPTALAVSHHDDATSPTLKGLANSSGVLGDEIDNTTSRHLYLALELRCKGTSAFSSGGQVDVYLIPSIDGTNYTNGDASVTPPSTQWRWGFPVRADANQHVLAAEQVQVPPLKFKLLVVNRTGQALTNTDAENGLQYRLYSEEGYQP